MTQQTLYQCADCGLHYTTREKADECFRHCTTYHACNLDITRHSIERQRSGTPQPKKSD